MLVANCHARERAEPQELDLRRGQAPASPWCGTFAVKPDRQMSSFRPRWTDGAPFLTAAVRGRGIAGPCPNVRGGSDCRAGAAMQPLVQGWEFLLVGSYGNALRTSHRTGSYCDRFPRLLRPSATWGRAGKSRCRKAFWTAPESVRSSGRRLSQVDDARIGFGLHIRANRPSFGSRVHAHACGVSSPGFVRRSRRLRPWAQIREGGVSVGNRTYRQNRVSTSTQLKLFLLRRSLPVTSCAE